MYKTVRHGENSLQYTILPQNDDFRVESGNKLSSARDIGGSGGVHYKRGKKKSCFAYFGLLFVCTVIIGAVLIPFLVSTQCLPNPTDWFIKTKNSLSSKLRGTSSTNSNNNNNNNYKMNININNNNNTFLNKTIQNAAIKISSSSGSPSNVFNQSILSSISSDNNNNFNKKFNNSIRSNKKKFVGNDVNDDDDDDNTVIVVTSSYPKRTFPFQNHNNYVGNSKEKYNKDNNNNPATTNIDESQQIEIQTTVKNKNKLYDMIHSNNNNNNNNNMVYQTENYEKNVISHESSSAHQDDNTNNYHEAAVAAAAAAARHYSKKIISNDEKIISKIEDSNNNGKKMFDKNYKEIYSIDDEINHLTTNTIIPFTIMKKKVISNNNNNNYNNNEKVPDDDDDDSILLSSSSSLSSTKKPIILPVLAKTNSILKENGKIIQNTQTESGNWIKSHWPFIDPSTYFQWTGYKTEDSVILPAILGITLVSIILLGSVCLVVRNKKSLHLKARKRNRIVKMEESGDDNATLLTTSSLSDDD